VSLWYHPVYEGAYDHLVVQGRPHRVLGIWTRIVYPNGTVQAFYEATNGQGYWAKDFQIPRGVVRARSGQSFITFQLWKGSATAKTFDTFVVV